MAIINPGGGGGNTNLSITTRTATNLTVASSTGSGAVVPVATDLLAGLLNATDKKKLDGIKQECLSLTYTFTAAGSQIADDGATGALGDLAKVGQLIVITGTVSNDGIYTVASIVDIDTITVVEALVDEASIAAEICATTVGEGNTFTAAATAPLSPSYGDLWYDTVNEILFVWISDGTSDLWLGLSPGGGGPVQNWASGTEYATQQLVFEEKRIYRSNTAHTAGATFDGDRANWDVITVLPFDTWLTATYYYVDDLVFEENRIYKANTAHTSGVFDTDRANWDMMQTIPAGQNWGASTYYYANDIVVESDKLYRRIASGTSGLTFDVTEEAAWVNLSAAGGGITIWATATDYVVGDVVATEDRIFICNTDNTSTTFDADRANWDILQTAPIKDWVANTYYYAGEITWQDPYFLRRLFDGTSGASFDNTEKTNWAKISAVTPQVWAASTRYYGGDLVTQNEFLLQRIIAGTSNATFDVAEAIAWEYVGFQEILDWQPNINYVLNSIVGNGGNRVIQNVGIHVGGATFDAAEAANWRLIAPMVPTDWQATTYYYLGEQAFNNGVLYQRNSAGTSGATFDTTEAANWTEIGTASNPFVKTITVVDTPYTVLSADGNIFVDSSGGNIVINYDITLPEGKLFNMGYTQTANTITIQGSGGATVMSPVSFTQVASFVAPGTAGQQGTTQWFRVGTEFLFNG